MDLTVGRQRDRLRRLSDVVRLATWTEGHADIHLVRLDDVTTSRASETGVLRTAGTSLAAVSRDPAIGIEILPASSRPDLRYHVFENALVESATTAVQVGRTLMVEGDWSSPTQDLRSPSIIEHAGSIAAVRRTEPIRVERGIFLGGYWPRNWGHWLIDMLPRMHLAEQLPPHLRSVPALVPQHVIAPGPFQQSLARFTTVEEAIPLEPKRSYLVGSLVWIHSPKTATANRRPGHLTRAQGLSTGIDREAFEDYRATLLERCGIRPSRDPWRKIFLTRGPNSTNRQRLGNQDEISTIAERRGFEPVVMEDLTFDDQVRTFAEAAFVCGPTGAAWSNLLFASPGCRALEITPTQRATHQFFARLAVIAGVDLRVLPVETSATSLTELVKTEFEVEPRRFNDALARLGA